MRQSIQIHLPIWVEKQNGVYIPSIGMVLKLESFTAKATTWYDQINYARRNHCSLASKDQLLLIYMQRSEINRELSDHTGEVLPDGIFVSSTPYDDKMTYSVDINEGTTRVSRKCVTQRALFLEPLQRIAYESPIIYPSCMPVRLCDQSK